MNQTVTFTLPEHQQNADGDVRRVGFEIEFSGLSLEQAVSAVQSSLNGRLKKGTAAEQVVTVDDLGDFNIEIDWDFLKRTARELGEDSNSPAWLDKVSHASALLVPIEVVCPPIALNQLDKLTPMVEALRNLGAIGTQESLIAAYGVHINPELPELDVDTIYHYLRAFCLLQWWLVEENRVDPARKLSPYIQLFSEEYIKQLLVNKPKSVEQLIDDYLVDNSSRNRALDMLPLFAHLDEKRVRDVVDDPKIKSRPTFHYRLPNCNIEQADWSLAKSWNRWCVLEKLANDHQALDRLAQQFIDADRPLIGLDRREWIKVMTQWIKDHE
ncbi:amidoligase family protein [Thalassotalea ganghwensis]